MTKALVFGAGGVGCVFGYILEKAGVSVTAVCRSNYAKVKESGVDIYSKVFGSVKATPNPVRTVLEAQEFGPFDYVLVCSKAFPGTSQSIKDAVTSKTAIVLAQNGIGIEEEYTETFPDNPVISGAVYLPTTQTEPGVIEMGPLELFEIGVYPAKSSEFARQQAVRLSELWKLGGGSCVVFDDIQSQKWIKVAVNAAWNPVTALTRCDDANFLRSSPGAEDMTRQIMKEVGRVAAASGYDVVTDAVIEHQLDRTRDRLIQGGKDPSMLTDIKNGRPIEVEAILGNTVRIADNLDVTAPYLRLLYHLAKGLNFSTTKPSEWGPLAAR